MGEELIEALLELEKEKGIQKEVILSAVEEALNASYCKPTADMIATGKQADTEVRIDYETGHVSVIAKKIVVEEVTDESCEISLAKAQSYDPTFEVGEIAEEEITPSNFGRIAAQKAKQIILQKLKDVERSMLYETYSEKKDDIVTGTIQRIEYKNGRDGEEKVIHIELGRIDGILRQKEQVEGESYKVYDRLKAYVVEVKDKGKKKSQEPCVILSRSHPNLVRRLLEMEVPEIQNGTVEIKSIAREAGSRSKIAVYSNNENVEPVGACIGPKGTRIQNVVDELRGERIDIIKWSQDPEELIASSLSPARVLRTYIDEEAHSALVVVPEDQLSLAIGGNKGQNVRLAAKLTGWRIDIKSDAEVRQNAENAIFGGEEE